MSAATTYMTLLRQRGGVSITVVSDPTVNVAPVIGATPDVTPAVWSSGASDTQRWEMADTDAGPWSTVSDMPAIDTPYTDQTFGKVLRWVEAQGAVTAESAATAAVVAANTVLHFDASDTSTLFQDSAGSTPAIADGNPVGRVTDKSGAGNHVTQPTTGNKPTLKLAIKNGKAVLRFVTDDYMDGPVWTLTQPVTMFIVAQTSSTAGQNFIRSTTGGAEIGLLAVSVTNIQTLFAGASLAGSTAITSAWRIHSFIANGASSLLYMNGTQTASGNAGVQNSAAIRIGASAALGGYLAGDIAEIIVIDAAVSAGLRAAIEAHLNAKWAVY